MLDGPAAARSSAERSAPSNVAGLEYVCSGAAQKSSSVLEVVAFGGCSGSGGGDADGHGDGGGGDTGAGSGSGGSGGGPTEPACTSSPQRL